MNKDIENFWEDEDFWEDSGALDAKELFEPTLEDEYSFEGNEEFDEAIEDIDFSMFKGDFKHSIKKIKHKIKTRAPKKRKPLTKVFDVQDKQSAIIRGKGKQIGKIIVPRDRDVTVEGVSEFILSSDNDQVKNIGYYKGKKLKELVLTMNNNSGSDLELELFNPSMPLDYLFNTSLNLNDKIAVAGQSRVSYTDLLHNLLANPTLIANARFVVSGPSVALQKSEKLTFINKAIDGEATVKPMQLALNFDIYQQQNDVILFDIIDQLNRVFIPDGMDIIQYKVLAGNSVTFCFYYKQKSLKKLLWKEARKKTLILDEYKQIL